MVILSKFVENLNDLLFDAGITRKQLSENTGIDKASITRYFQGNCIPNLNSIIKLAEFFNCSIDFLIGKTEEKPDLKFLPCPPFSTRLALYLSKYNGTPYALCKELHLPDNRFYGWLSGTNFPTIENVEKLADHFKCTIDQFLGRES